MHYSQFKSAAWHNRIFSNWIHTMFNTLCFTFSALFVIRECCQTPSWTSCNRSFLNWIHSMFNTLCFTFSALFVIRECCQTPSWTSCNRSFLNWIHSMFNTLCFTFSALFVIRERCRTPSWTSSGRARWWTTQWPTSTAGRSSTSPTVWCRNSRSQSTSRAMANSSSTQRAVSVVY